MRGRLGRPVAFTKGRGTRLYSDGFAHRIVNPSFIDLVIIEVQSGEYLGKDDIVRFEDCYGRV